MQACEQCIPRRTVTVHNEIAMSPCREVDSSFEIISRLPREETLQ